MWDGGWVKDESSRMPTPLVSKLPLRTQSSDVFVSCPLFLLTARPILLLVAVNWMFLPRWPTVTSTQHVPDEMNYSFTSPPPVSILNSLHSCVFFEKNTMKYKITQISDLGFLIISYVTTANLTCITSVFPCLTPSSIVKLVNSDPIKSCHSPTLNPLVPSLVYRFNSRSWAPPYSLIFYQFHSFPLHMLT